MRKIESLITLLLCVLLMACLAGCGKEETQQYFDLQVERKAFYDVAGANEGIYTSFINMQFYQGEPVQIWVVYDGVSDMDAYMYRMDGSKKLLLENVPMEYVRENGFVDKDGNYYYWAFSQGNIIKVDPSGKQLFDRQLSDFGIFKIEKLCQMGDGRLYAKYVEENQGAQTHRLCEMNPDTGEIIKIDNGVSEMDSTTYMAAGEGCLYYMTEEEVWRIDVERGLREEVWSFAGTSYAIRFNADYPVWDFRIQEDGSLELLEAGNRIYAEGEDGSFKTLRKEAVGEGREVVVLRGTDLVDDAWLKGCIRSFNEQSGDWYVMLEECGTDDSLWDDYARQTSMEIAAGKGPDILYGNVLADYAYGVYRQGGFADLSSYLEDSGLRREDFFPCVFDWWQDNGKIFGVALNISFNSSIVMDAAVLEGNGEPDIETLVNALLDWEGDAALLRGAAPWGVLERFLVGTENLWGMVDWEKGDCDFDTELFVGMLEAAKRYGRSGKDDARPILAESEIYTTYQYRDRALLEKSGKVRVDVLFDDGCHASAYSDCVVAVNANSRQKDGAWEFIRFVLEEGQMLKQDEWRYPADKKAFDKAMASEKAKGLWKENNAIYNYYDGTMIYFYPLTDERIQELKEVLEDARFTPVRTKPILDIIYEEASGYFNGTKSAEETIHVINNRVQVYLDEGAAQ